MCGIAGIIHRGVKTISVGDDSMLQVMKHRGPDSTGFAVYGSPRTIKIVMRIQICRAGRHVKSGFDIHER